MFISFFIGGVIALQTALNLEDPLIPESLLVLPQNDRLF